MSEMYHVARKAAETMEGKCEHPKPGIFATRQTQCYWHESNWPDGRAVCDRMADYIRLAEQAIEDAEPIIRADERERLVRTYDGSAAYAAIAAERDAAREALALLEEKP